MDQTPSEESTARLDRRRRRRTIRDEGSGPRRPELVIFDVNETLSDMSGLANRFAELGLPHRWLPRGSPASCGTGSR